MGGLLLGTPANQAIVPQVKPLDKSGEFYLGPFGDFTIGRDKAPVKGRRLGFYRTLSVVVGNRFVRGLALAADQLFEYNAPV